MQTARLQRPERGWACLRLVSPPFQMAAAGCRLRVLTWRGCRPPPRRADLGSASPGGAGGAPWSPAAQP